MNGMEINNGIIIDGVLHESSEGFCNECSLYRECCNILDDTYCSILDLGMDQCFVNRGKVTEIRGGAMKARVKSTVDK